MLDRRKQLQSAHLSGRNAARRERGLLSLFCGWGVILLLMKSEGSVKKKLNYRTINQSRFANCTQKSLFVFPSPLLSSRFFFRSCVCIPPGENYVQTFLKFAESFFFFFALSLSLSLSFFYSRWRRWRRITRQMGETGGMTGNDGFEAMQWMNGTRHSPLSCRKHPKPTLCSSICLYSTPCQHPASWTITPQM